MDNMRIYEVEHELEYHKWAKEIPCINFPSDWLIQMVPPFACAIVRFTVTTSKIDDNVSIYLDCYDKLGSFGEPYWEVYPYNDDVGRCAMKDIDDLMEMIATSIESMESGK